DFHRVLGAVRCAGGDGLPSRIKGGLRDARSPSDPRGYGVDVGGNVGVDVAFLQRNRAAGGSRLGGRFRRTLRSGGRLGRLRAGGRGRFPAGARRRFHFRSRGGHRVRFLRGSRGRFLTGGRGRVRVPGRPGGRRRSLFRLRRFLLRRGGSFRQRR